MESDLRRDFSDRYGRYASEHRGHGMEAHQTLGGKLEHASENLKDSVREGWYRFRGDFPDNDRR